MTNEQIVSELQAGINKKCNMLLLWEQNKGMIYTLARRLSGYMELEDLLQQGFIALVAAANVYDPERGNFCNFAFQMVKGELFRYVANTKYVVRLPEYMQRLITRYNQVWNDALKTQGRHLSFSEMCAALSVDSDTLYKIMTYSTFENIDSLDRNIGGEDEKAELHEVIAGAENTEEIVAEQVFNEELRESLEKCLEYLTPDQAQVIRLRYFEGNTLTDIATKMEKTISRAQAIDTEALDRLRKGKPRKILLNFLDSEADRYAGAYHGVGTKSFNSSWTSSTEREALKSFWDDEDM